MWVKIGFFDFFHDFYIFSTGNDLDRALGPVPGWRITFSTHASVASISGV